MRFSLLGQLLAIGLVSCVAAQEVECWAPDGKTRADNETYVPCNKLGIQQDGIFSSCCALDGTPDKRDTCTSLGLCSGADRRLRRGFCTDKTWKSKACVDVCITTQDGGDASNSSVITACNDGSNKYCCGDTRSCCGTSRAITIPMQESVCTAHTLDSEGGVDATTFKNATIGLAVVAGASLLAAVASTLWFLRQNKSLKKQLADEKLAAGHQQASMSMHNRASAVSTMTDSTTHHPSLMADHSQPYYRNKTPGSPPPPHPPLSPNSEVHHGNMHRYSELDAGTNRIEMASPDPYTQQNRNST
ncbi:hypothetical protein PG993_002304 [Apiospora rasikravindrae]|uniref:Uncharacterized protein n=1 Tax=Apiospora rasikravindrae TaxID=990691 RepID=A0ABR1TW97_9PEZI